jgi:osmotically-inducible protein OsmY
MADAPLERNVADELFWDPMIVDSNMIAVAADDAGTITLRGTVGSFRQRREAKKAAELVWGVTKVTNDLDVRLLTEHRREDGELRREVLQALMLDTLVPTTIEVSVSDGLVILTGSVDWQYQREEAEFIAGNILGVTGVENDVYLAWPTSNVGDVQQSIKKALERDAKLDADSLVVASSDGTVTLRGSVRSWSEHDAAVGAAWAAPGVRTVHDHLTVSY